jgi:hypothetical protein
MQEAGVAPVSIVSDSRLDDRGSIRARTKNFSSSPDVPKLWGASPPRERCWSSGGSRVFCKKDIFILNDVWPQDKIYILVGTLLG